MPKLLPLVWLAAAVVVGFPALAGVSVDSPGHDVETDSSADGDLNVGDGESNNSTLPGGR